MGTAIESYPSDLTEEEWKILKPLIPKEKTGRRRQHDLKAILNAIFYLVRQGCTWRGLPHDFPPYRIVFYYFSKWQESGVWEQINDMLRDKVRITHSKKSPECCDYRLSEC
jgi:putative transposase